MVDPAHVVLAPLVERLLLPDVAVTEKIWEIGHYSRIKMDSVLSKR
jgi:hypothetical protein